MAGQIDLGKLLNAAPGFGDEAVEKATEVEFTAQLDVRSPFMERAAREHTAHLIVGVNQQTKRAVRRIIQTASTAGYRRIAPLPTSPAWWGSMSDRRSP